MSNEIRGWFWKAEGARPCLTGRLDDWVGDEPLGSGVEGDGGGRDLLTIGTGGVNGGCSERTCTDCNEERDLLGPWFWAGGSCKPF